MKTIEQLLGEHRFFAGFDDDLRRLVAGCARNHHFKPGAYLFHEAAAADTFYVIRHGRVALEMLPPGKHPLVFATLGDGEIVGASWLVPPYRWTFDARAVEVTRVIAIDAKCLRDKCEANHDLGYEMFKRFMSMMVQELHDARLQILDVYGTD